MDDNKKDNLLLCSVVIVIGCVVFALAFRSIGSPVAYLASWVIVGTGVLTAIGFFIFNFKKG